MKKLLISSFFILFAISTVNAQFFKQSDIDIYKNDVAKQAKNLVKENLDLTEEQAKIFWPLYEEYRAESADILNEELKVSEDYLMNYYILEDSKAIELLRKIFELRRNKIDLQEKYLKKMAKVLPATIVGKFYQIDHRLELMISQQRTEKIPLVRDQDKD